ncbi:MAG: glycosyltransferase family 2 protein, partial [bacterium]
MIPIAILIPAFNVRNHLKFILPKLIAQYPEAFIIVVDDGSSDGTCKILGSEYGDQTIFLRHPENRGKGAA